jgi:hypothetical protein
MAKEIEVHGGLWERGVKKQTQVLLFDFYYESIASSIV